MKFNHIFFMRHIHQVASAAFVALMAFGAGACSDGNLYDEDMTISLLNSEGDQLAIGSSDSDDDVSDGSGGGYSSSSSSSSSDLIVGRWVHVLTTFSDGSDSIDDSFTITFKANGTGTVTGKSPHMGSGPFTWYMSNGKLAIIGPGGSGYLDIVTLTKSSLVTRIREDGVTETSKFRRG